MDRRAKRNISFVPLFALVGVLALGCGRTPPDAPTLSIDTDVRPLMAAPAVVTLDTTGGVANQETATLLPPNLLTAPEIAQAEPLLVPAKPCEYRQGPPPILGSSSGSHPNLAPSNLSPPNTIPALGVAAENPWTRRPTSSVSPFPPLTDDSPSPGVLPVAPLLGSSGNTAAIEIPWPREVGQAETGPPSFPAPTFTARNPGPNAYPSSYGGTATAPAMAMPPLATPVTSSDLDAARRQADEALRRGFALAERGALFSARSEFTHSLRHLAQALDAAHGTTLHTRSLVSGLRALQEADDFVPKGSRIETKLPLKVLIASHQTPVLKAHPEDVSPTAAIQAYHEFAQTQLAVSLDREPLGSLALFALAKIKLASESGPTPNDPANSSKAIALHRAATIVEPQNFLASNELGVLLAKQGRWQEARTILEYSLSTSPQVVTYQNLASVFQNLGDTAAAGQMQQMATQLAVRSGSVSRPGASPAVQWLDTATFAQTNIPPGNSDASPTAVGRAVAKPQMPQQTAQKTTLPDDKRGASGYFPWSQPKRN